MSPNIERVSVSDAEEILALQKLAYQSEAEIYSIPPLVQTLEEMEADLSPNSTEGNDWFKDCGFGESICEG